MVKLNKNVFHKWLNCLQLRSYDAVQFAGAVPQMCTRYSKTSVSPYTHRYWK